MNDQLDQTILEMVRTYLRSLSDRDFLALTCNLSALCAGLVRVVYDEVKAESEKRNLLDEQHELFREIADLETQQAPKKAKLRGINEALAAMMPKSKAIHYTPVVQVS